MWFEAISGLKVNLEKNELIPIGKVEYVVELESKIGCGVEQFPTTYLGIPLGALFKLVVA